MTQIVVVKYFETWLSLNLFEFHELCKLHNISELNITYDVFFPFCGEVNGLFQATYGQRQGTSLH